MLRLTTLGALVLESDRRPLVGAALHRRPLALLAIVAQGAHGVSPDKLLAYLWPEKDVRRAQNCLKQTMFALRRDLGQGLFLRSATTIRLDPRVCTADCWEFESALERRALREAVEIYGGPFLDGFYLEKVAGFERWIEAVRARLAHRHQVALEALVAEAEHAGDWVGAVEWWRRLAEHDPLSSRIAVGLMRALEAAGDRAEALRFAQRHERMLSEELNARPDTGERVFVERLRRQVAVNSVR